MSVMQLAEWLNSKMTEMHVSKTPVGLSTIQIYENLKAVQKTAYSIKTKRRKDPNIKGANGSMNVKNKDEYQVVVEVS
jgi:hypothetical protein